MKITCSRVDDVIKRRDDYESKMNRFRQLKDDYEESYYAERHNVSSSVEDEIRKYLKNFNLLDLSVECESSYRSKIEVTIKNEPGYNKNCALRWSYRVRIDSDGGVESESDSWSGLNACGKESIASLRQTVDCLEILNNIDWSRVLDVTFPEYSFEYSKDRWELEKSKPNFAEELKDAYVEDYSSTNTWFLCRIDSEGYNRRGKYWVRFERMTDKMYYITYLVEPVYSTLDDNDLKNYDQKYGDRVVRIRKSSIRFVDPITMKEF